MKAMVFHGPGQRRWEEVARPEIDDDGDAVVRVDAVTICGTDLHILKGHVPAVTDGRILGHEAIGTVEAVGPGARTVAPGDRVLVSCISACGRCRCCRQASYGQCLGGGRWILGHKIDGTQAEHVRVPFADTSTGLVDTYSVPQLLALVAQGRMDTKPFVTHRFPLDACMEAYDQFSDPQATGALTVVLTRD